jgi:heat shock protein HslJ
MKPTTFLVLIAVLAFVGCNAPDKKHSPAASNEKTDASGNAMELLDTYWKLVEINGQPVTNPPANQNEAYIILKKEGSRIVGSTSCNAMTGTFVLGDGNSLTFSGVASTKMACPDMTLESEMGKAISMTDNYAIDGKFLMLHKAKMAPLAKFEAQPQNH